MLQGPLYYLKAVREVSNEFGADGRKGEGGPTDEANLVNGHRKKTAKKSKWSIEFRDVPDAGAHEVTSRLMSRTVVEEGDLFGFLDGLGFE